MNNLLKSKEACKDKLLDLLAANAYKHGDFILSSGKKSNHYVNCKPVTLSGVGLSLTSNLLLSHVEEDSVAVSGLTLGADPLVSGVAITAFNLDRELEALIIRKEAKGHGTSAWIEGPSIPDGSLVTVLEDVVTTGASSLKAVFRLRDAGYSINRIVSIVDRNEGGAQMIEKNGIELISLFSIDEVSSRSRELFK